MWTTTTLGNKFRFEPNPKPTKNYQVAAYLNMKLTEITIKLKQLNQQTKNITWNRQNKKNRATTIIKIKK